MAAAPPLCDTVRSLRRAAVLARTASRAGIVWTRRGEPDEWIPRAPSPLRSNLHAPAALHPARSVALPDREAREASASRVRGGASRKTAANPFGHQLAARYRHV